MSVFDDYDISENPYAAPDRGRGFDQIDERRGQCRIVDYDDDSSPGLARIFFLRQLVPESISRVSLPRPLFSIADPLFIFGEDRR